MAVVNAAQAVVKTVADPNASYESLKGIWDKSRAVCNGERFVKDYDNLLDTVSFRNLLIPFSPSMTPPQYAFYKAEAELPGITAQFSKMLVGGLLRKTPSLTLPDDVPEDAQDWIINEFARDDSSLVSFLDSAIWEEMQTSRAWVFVDYPNVKDPDSLTKEELSLYKPYPILYKAESIINWHVIEDEYGKTLLNKVIVRGLSESFVKNEFHPTFNDTVWVHELDKSGFYQIRVFQREDQDTDVPVVNGIRPVSTIKKHSFKLIDTIRTIKRDGERLRFIPAWPLNGSIDLMQPILTPIIDKEIALYNKISRRNHLLYGAATYTPYICSDMADEDFDKIVNAGLGSWFKLEKDATANVLATPTDALEDMDRTIAAGIEEMARLGIRMLTPETEQSGVALEIRNAAQTAQMGSLNNKISQTMRQIIAFMLNWRYGKEYKASDIQFALSADFNPVPLGADWLTLATTWYETGLIPRSVWLLLLKHNDIIPPDYDDEEGQEEIAEDMENRMSRERDDYAERLELETDAQVKVSKAKPKVKPKK